MIYKSLDIPRDEIEDRPISDYKKLIWRSGNVSALNFGGKFELSMPTSKEDKDRENLEYFRKKGLIK